MIIDIDTGKLCLKERIFGHKMTYPDSLKQLSDLNYELADYQNGYKWIFIKCIEISNSFFYVGLCFKNDLLDLVDLGFSTLEELKKNTWDNWIESNELSKKEIYEKWLNETIGSKRVFVWGKIESYFDPKGGTSGIVIRYNK